MRASALYKLDLVIRSGSVTAPLDTAEEWAAQRAVFGQALDGVMPITKWKALALAWAWASAVAEPEWSRSVRTVGATNLVPQFVRRYCGTVPDTYPSDAARDRVSTL